MAILLCCPQVPNNDQTSHMSSCIEAMYWCRRVGTYIYISGLFRAFKGLRKCTWSGPTLGTLLYNERNSPLTTLENAGGKDKILSFQEGKNKLHEKDQESEWHRVLNSHSEARRQWNIAFKILRKTRVTNPEFHMSHTISLEAMCWVETVLDTLDFKLLPPVLAVFCGPSTSIPLFWKLCAPRGNLWVRHPLASDLVSANGRHDWEVRGRGGER